MHGTCLQLPSTITLSWHKKACMPVMEKGRCISHVCSLSPVLLVGSVLFSSHLSHLPWSRAEEEEEGRRKRRNLWCSVSFSCHSQPSILLLLSPPHLISFTASHHHPYFLPTYPLPSPLLPNTALFSSSHHTCLACTCLPCLPAPFLLPLHTFAYFTLPRSGCGCPLTSCLEKKRCLHSLPAPASRIIFETYMHENEMPVPAASGSTCLRRKGTENSFCIIFLKSMQNNGGKYEESTWPGKHTSAHAFSQNMPPQGRLLPLYIICICTGKTKHKHMPGHALKEEHFVKKAYLSTLSHLSSFSMAWKKGLLPPLFLVSIKTSTQHLYRLLSKTCTHLSVHGFQ